MIRHLSLCCLLLVSASAFSFAEDKPAAATETPKIERLKADQWCWTHDLPKDKCVACDKKLIPALKKAGDYCPEHTCAESTCVLCDPKAKGRLDAMRPLEKPAAAK